VRKIIYSGSVAALAVLALPSVASADLLETTGITPAALLTINPATGSLSGTVTNGGIEIGTIVGGTVYSSSQGVAAMPTNTAPPINTVGNFLASGPSSSPANAPLDKATLTFDTPVTSFSFLLGSPDSYNTILVLTNNGLPAQTFTLAQLGITPVTGDQQYAEYVNFYTTGSTVIDAIRFNSTTDALEVSNFSVSAVPEASTWAMMVLGFCGLGFLAHRRRNQTALTVA
jgi:hypothetical protein